MENKASAPQSGAVLKGMLCYLKELARLDHLGALVLPYCAFILAASGEVFGAGGNKGAHKARREAAQWVA